MAEPASEGLALDSETSDQVEKLLGLRHAREFVERIHERFYRLGKSLALAKGGAGHLKSGWRKKWMAKTGWR